jgi:hypothetical protein
MMMRESTYTCPRLRRDTSDGQTEEQLDRNESNLSVKSLCWRMATRILGLSRRVV